MAEQINWTVSVQVAGGPSVSISQALTVDAYDVVAVTVPHGGTGTDVHVHPGSQLEFLMITTDQAGDTLTYAGTGAKVSLDQKAQVFIGAGSVSPLGDITKLHFDNNLTNGADANVQILVGRKT
jgi:hypothetical protein